MSNIYSSFKEAQARKDACYNKLSASFILKGTYSVDITHVRTNTVKKAAISFKEKEGPDQVSVFTIKDATLSNNLAKGDYFIHNNTYYLIYEKVKLIDENIIYLKHRARECNVSFSINNKTIYGYFAGSMDKYTDISFEKSFLINDKQKPMLILPSLSFIEIGKRITIGGRPWKIIDFDNITNSGITYISLDSSFEENIPVNIIEPEEEETNNILKPLVEYTFDTTMGFFASVPKVDIIERKSSSIKFSIPLGINNITISVKDSENEIVETEYKVVL